MREFTSASTESFAESLGHLPDQEALYEACHERSDRLRLSKITDLFRQRKLDKARPLAEAVLMDPDSTIETKFWAHIQLEGIDFSETVHAGKPQSELPKLHLAHARALQKLTAKGPKPLKFYSLIAKHAAELEILVHENFSLFMAGQQHSLAYGDPIMSLALYARRSALTKQIVSKYNRCVLLARYASKYPDRWVLGRALTNIVRAIARYLITLRSERELDAERAFAQSALQICKLAAWISSETADTEGVILAILNALMTTDSEHSDAYRWAIEAANRLGLEARNAALITIERARKRWKGQRVEGDYQGDTIWQIFQNIATGLGVSIDDENDPLVRGLRIAARDNSPERVLARCENLLVSQGATGPVARQIWKLFNITNASSKVVHCTLHNLHVEGKELDSAYAEFKRNHCDSCPDQKPTPEGWRYTDEIREVIHRRHYDFVARLAGTSYGLRYTKED
jgi:hypothetical protein